MQQIERLESRQLLASQGAVDTTFGVDGRARFELADNESVYAQTIGDDGSVFVAFGANSALRVIKFDATGTIDRSYGDGDGVVELPASISSIKQMRALRFGKLMVTGASTADSSPATGSDMIAMRLGIRGEPDKSFGKNGIARVDLVSAEVGEPVNDGLRVSDISADGAVVLLSRMFYHNDTVGSEMGIAMLRPFSASKG